MLSASKLGVLLMDQVLILRDQIWTIKLDFREDQRILINKYLMTFNPFSNFCTEKLVAIFAIFRFYVLYVQILEIFKFDDFESRISVERVENGLKVMR